MSDAYSRDLRAIRLDRDPWEDDPDGEQVTTELTPVDEDGNPSGTPSSEARENGYAKKRRMAREWIDDLLRLENQTHPDHGKVSEAGKHARARKAIWLLDHLVAELGGWAIHHNLGLAIAEKSAYPIIPTDSMREQSDVQERMDFLDSHEHETRAETQLYEEEVFSPSAARLALLNVGLIGFPMSLEGMITLEIEALRWGDKSEIFEPQPTGFHGSATTWMLKLRAISYVEHWNARGMKKMAVCDDVVDAFGLSTKDTRRWKTVADWYNDVRAPGKFDEMYVREALGTARHHASLIKADPIHSEYVGHLYSRERLIEWGRRFQDLNPGRTRGANDAANDD